MHPLTLATEPRPSASQNPPSGWVGPFRAPCKVPRMAPPHPPDAHALLDDRVGVALGRSPRPVCALGVSVRKARKHALMGGLGRYGAG